MGTAVGFEERLGTLIKVEGVNRLSGILAEFKEDFNGNTYVTSERVFKTIQLDFANSMVKPRIIGSDLKVTAYPTARGISWPPGFFGKSCPRYF